MIGAQANIQATHTTHTSSDIAQKPQIGTAQAKSSPLPTPPAYTAEKLHGIPPPPPQPHTNRFVVSTHAEAQMDPWERPGSTRKIVLRSGKAHKSPTLRVVASLARNISPSNWSCSLLMGSAGFTAPRTH